MQSRQPCAVHVPHATSSRCLSAFRARWSRTAAFPGVMASRSATAATGTSSISTARRTSAYSSSSEEDPAHAGRDVDRRERLRLAGGAIVDADPRVPAVGRPVDAGALVADEHVKLVRCVRRQRETVRVEPGEAGVDRAPRLAAVRRLQDAGLVSPDVDDRGIGGVRGDGHHVVRVPVPMRAERHRDPRAAAILAAVKTAVRTEPERRPAASNASAWTCSKDDAAARTLTGATRTATSATSSARNRRVRNRTIHRRCRPDGWRTDRSARPTRALSRQ